MANDNSSLFWIALLAVGGYLWYSHSGLTATAPVNYDVLTGPFPHKAFKEPLKPYWRYPEGPGIYRKSDNRSFDSYAAYLAAGPGDLTDVETVAHV